MKDIRRPPTMKDVAREAGVALGTVSKVFNDLPVGDSYRQRVEAAAEKLGYRVNSYARGLRAEKTNTVAVILPSTDHTFFALLADHLCTALTRRNARMLLALTKSDPDTEAKCIEMVQQNKVDGIIGLTYSSNLNIDKDLPYVSIDRYAGPEIPCVASDNFTGGSLAAQKLSELGCKRLLLLHAGSAVPGEADKRSAGFVSYCQLHGLSYEAQHFIEIESMAPVLSYLDSHFKAGAPEFDGIFCSTDLLCDVARAHLEQLGVHVPQDVQMIGFDGIRRIDSNGSLFCSTIVQPVEQMAETAVYVLLDEDRSRQPALICLPVTYMPGGTTREPY